MPHPAPADPIDKALTAMEADILPALSELLRSITDKARSAPDYDSSSIELREMSRKIIDLTRFLASVTGGPFESDNGVQDPRI